MRRGPPHTYLVYYVANGTTRRSVNRGAGLVIYVARGNHLVVNYMPLKCLGNLHTPILNARTRLTWFNFNKMRI